MLVFHEFRSVYSVLLVCVLTITFKIGKISKTNELAKYHVKK